MSSAFLLAVIGTCMLNATNECNTGHCVVCVSITTAPRNCCQPSHLQLVGIEPAACNQQYFSNMGVSLYFVCIRIRDCM